jgi:hypothetical protein
MAKACGHSPEFKVQWASVSDELIKKYTNISDWLGTILGELKAACVFDAVKTYTQQLKSITCEVGSRTELWRVSSTLRFSLLPRTINLQAVVRDKIGQLKVDAQSTLLEQIQLEQTHVCLGEKNQVIVLAPSDAPHPGLSYGDGKILVNLGNNFNESPEQIHFVDPRYSSQKASSRDQLDKSYWPSVSVKDGKCLVRCGKRETRIPLANHAKVAEIVGQASFKPYEKLRQAYALARDSWGVYYYVDRGSTEATEKDFRVYIGKRGQMKLQRMKDIVSDSEGEIFSTMSGALRLVVGKEDALWITGSKKNKLLRQNVNDNLAVIYNELGVYLAMRLGTPCDDF